MGARHHATTTFTLTVWESQLRTRSGERPMVLKESGRPATFAQFAGRVWALWMLTSCSLHPILPHFQTQRLKRKRTASRRSLPSGRLNRDASNRFMTNNLEKGVSSILKKKQKDVW